MQYFGHTFLLLLYVTSFVIINITGRKHRIRHTWEKRHKRQGVRVPLPGVFVTSGGQGPDRGPWSPWSEPTECSRSCGGGVATQNRYCIEPNACSGPTSIHFSCNIQDCPTNEDFRAKQCSEFNSIPFEGVYYQWIPYIKAPNKCELNCMPKGERFYYRHKKQVIDGTRCDNEKLDVCVQGICQHVGCDRNLGSNATEDKCRQCGGDGSTCNTVQNDLDMLDLQVGYNDILLIPNGAVNVLVEEKAPSNNYLAIRNTSGHYYLNGNWRIDFPRNLNFAGTTFLYERNTHGFSAPDKISCLGPTTEPLYIVLLSQDDNVGVRYEYSINKGRTLISARDNYTWTHEDFSQCSARCGGGYQIRRVTCINERTSEIAEPNLCDGSTMPSSNQTCGMDACEAHWIHGPWSECSSLCGDNGVQTRQVYCEQIISNNMPSIVPDEKCLKMYPNKPDTQQPCNTKLECPKWFIEPWKPCDHLCGDGIQVRNVICYRKINNRINVLPDSACEQVQIKPETQKKCLLEPCKGVDWIVSEWSGCEKCGLVNETRTVQCATEDGEIYPDNLCDKSRIPNLARKCTQAKQCEFVWYASQWTECSAKCGNGIQNRKVFCVFLEDDVLKKVSDNKCDPDLKYSSIQNCTVEGECPGEWFSGPWSKCSKKCNGGEKTRKVLCIKKNETVSVDQCDSENILFSSEQCNTESCDEVKELSTTVSYETTESDDYEDCEELDYDIDEEEQSTINPKESDTNESDLMTSLVSSLSDSDLMLSDSTIEHSTIITISGDGNGSSEDTVTTITSEITTESLSTTEKEDTSQDTTMQSTIFIETSTDSIMTTELDTSISTENSEVTTESFFSTTNPALDSTTNTQTTESILTEATTIEENTTTESITTEATTINESTTTEATTIDESTTTELTITTESETTSVLTTLETIVSTISTTVSDLFSTTTNSETETETETKTTTSIATETTTDYSSSTETEVETLSTTEMGTTSISEITTEAEASTASTQYVTEPTTELETETATISTETMTETISTESAITDISTITDYDGLTTEYSTPYTIDDIISTTTQQIKKCKIRPKKPAACKNSEFGCCSDGETKATGPFHKGCPIYKTCNETKFGCCSDNVSAAKGPHNKGCPKTNCTSTLYGCCPDKKNIAQGNDYLGCIKETTKPKCHSSKYGCCNDNSTAAKGPNQKGCIKDNCSSSQFGCCPNSTNNATGPNNQGCETIIESNCTNTRFGCCSDNKTPAHGPNKEGCCLLSPYGCCPDNFQAAQGPNYQDCHCRYSLYGCCSDNTTYAKGFNFDGCQCQDTEFGCCPDELTIAKGPNYHKCPCTAFQFGCCSDGITIAKGPHNQGCGCKDSEFGCCPDEKTFANGPNFAGCDCSTSKYQCCLDGVSDAQGDNFEGCNKTLINAQEVCKLDKDTGPCRNFSIKWYFDMEYGGCSRFWYGGCDGNGNRFETDKECRQTCIEPNGKNICYLPKVPGPCEGYYPMWYFDTERKQCNQFIYRGCLGNNNKFEKREHCEEICPAVTHLEPCEQSMEKGPCNGNYTRWFFDKNAQICRPFTFGGCKGTDNNYMTENACKYQCLNPNKPRDICQLDKSEGNCTGKEAKWYFNRIENRCMPFYYSSCGASAGAGDFHNNRFDTYETCTSFCPSHLDRNICSLPAVMGDCRDYTIRWYYDTKDKKCRQFYYGGCSGNENNFESEDLCLSRCEFANPVFIEPEPKPEPKPVPNEFRKEYCYISPNTGNCQESQIKWFFDKEQKTCQNFTYSGCGGNPNKFNSIEECYYYCVDDVCSLPVNTGSNCDSYSIKWYYDTNSRECKQFTYGGCDGNPNRFDSQKMCQQRCKTETRHQPETEEYNPEDVSICYESLEKGNCSKLINMWHFDIEERKCIPFEYTGCGGNRNQFRSEEHCERHCGMYRSLDVCQIRTFDVGQCRGSFPKFYYNIQTDKCEKFIFGGCGGNGNRFSSVEECENLCVKHKDKENEIERESLCEEVQRDCQLLRCAYGLEKYVKNDCEYCKCYDPCEHIKCPENTQCVIEYNYGYNDESDLRFITDCKPVTKDGHCPTYIENNRNCSRDCNTDADCQGSMKCCRTNCGSLCLDQESQSISEVAKPQPEYATETYHPQSHYFEESEDDVSAEEGGYATFVCVVKSKYPNPKIIWRKNNLVIDGNLPRYRLRLDGSLQIVNLYKTDSGIYICIANVGEPNPVHKEFKLEVTEPTVRSASILGEEDNRFTVTLGQPAAIQCYAYGWPRPFITWWRSDNMLPLTSSEYEQRSDYSLFISSVQLSNLGVYTCQAYNGRGKAASWSVTLQTIGPIPASDSQDNEYLRYVIEPHHPITQSPAKQPVDSYISPVRSNIIIGRTSYRENENISMECIVEGQPKPKVTWYKNNATLQSSPSLQITDDYQIIILSANSNDSGQYKCEARNDYNIDESVINIIVEDIYVHPNCTDNEFFARCKLIVQAKYCTHKYYARFCCRSCTKAGQLPSYGTHLNPIADKPRT